MDCPWSIRVVLASIVIGLRWSILFKMSFVARVNDRNLSCYRSMLTICLLFRLWHASSCKHSRHWSVRHWTDWRRRHPNIPPCACAPPRGWWRHGTLLWHSSNCVVLRFVFRKVRLWFLTVRLFLRKSSNQISSRVSTNFNRLPLKRNTKATEIKKKSQLYESLKR